MRSRAPARVVLYGLSAFMDMVAGTLLFVAPVRAAQLGASYSLVGALGVAWGVGVSLMVVIGRYVTPANSAALCAVACVLQAALHASLILFASTPETMLPLLFAIGLTHTMFYVPYQVFFKTADGAGKIPLAASVSVYTFAWSMGMACGPLWSGFLMRESLGSLQGWQICLLFTILSLLFTGTTVFVLGRSRFPDAEDGGEAENRRHDFAMIAWLSAFCGSFAFSLVRGLFPAGAVKIGIPENVQGGVLFTMGMLQALSGLFLGRIAGWMYRPRLLAAGGGMGVAGMACFLFAFLGTAEGGWLLAAFFAGAFLFGLYSGSFYFYTVYHCLAHPNRAGFNVAVNECMFSAASVAGLLLGGALADAYGIDSPYLAAAILIVLFTAMQVKYHAAYPLPLTEQVPGRPSIDS